MGRLIAAVKGLGYFYLVFGAGFFVGCLYTGLGVGLGIIK